MARVRRRCWRDDAAELTEKLFQCLDEISENLKIALN